VGSPNNFSTGGKPQSSQRPEFISAFIERYRYSELGELVKGIIHNLNGSLQILSMQMELLERMLVREGEKIPPAIPKQMSQCLEQLEKFNDLIKVLIEKGVHDELDTPQLIQLNDLLEGELSLLHHNLFFKHQIKVQKNLAPDLPYLQGYYVDFSQGLLNLIHNAVEAMEESSLKKLTLVTGKKGDQVQIVIKDTGCGISQKIRDHLFQPFFTSKGGKHRGLGLFISRELLARYGASFSFSSKKGETTFTVHFPISRNRGI